MMKHHFWFLLPLFIGLSGCEKKDRLSADTFQFSINPPTHAVVQGTQHTFTAVSSIGGSPTWSVVPSTTGSLNTSVGTSVVFTGDNYGDAKIYATMEGVTAEAQVSVVSLIAGNASKFDIYTDEGLPSGTNYDSSLFGTLTGFMSEVDLGSEWAPEGVKIQRTNLTVAGSRYWGISLDNSNTKAPINLSAFSSGKLKFAIRLNRALGFGETIDIKIESDSANASVTLGGGHGFTSTNTEWQEISIDLSGFAINFTQVKVPFTILLNSVDVPLPFIVDIDAIRWE